MTVRQNKFALRGYSVLTRLIAGHRASKIFAIGLNKTGTTSLHRIFQDLGCRSYHGTKWRETSRPTIYRFYDAFCDGIPNDFRRLDAMFPNARFILQVRDLDAWLDSRLEHIRRLPKGKVRDTEWTATESALEAWIQKWNAHHLAVLSHFRNRPDDLLVVNYIRDPGAAAKIAVFLGHPVAIDKHHFNRNPGAGAELKNRDMIAAALDRLGVPEGEWKNDIHCPSLGGEVAGSLRADTSQIAAGAATRDGLV